MNTNIENCNVELLKKQKEQLKNEIIYGENEGHFSVLLESGRINHSESDRNSQFELNRNSQCTLAN